MTTKEERDYAKTLDSQPLKQAFVELDQERENLAKKYGFSEKQADCLGASVSGEMGNMFVMTRRYNISCKEWSSVIADMKKANPEGTKHLATSLRRWYIYLGETQNRALMDMVKRMNNRV